MDGNLYSLQPDKIILYGTSWCGDCRRTRRIFSQTGTSYDDIDIDADLEAETFVKQINHGNRSVPTIIFPDGSILVEPAEEALVAKLKSL